MQIKKPNIEDVAFGKRINDVDFNVNNVTGNTQGNGRSQMHKEQQKSSQVKDLLSN